MSILIDILKKTKSRAAGKKKSIPPTLDKIHLAEKKNIFRRYILISLFAIFLIFSGLAIVFLLNTKPHKKEIVDIARSKIILPDKGKTSEDIISVTKESLTRKEPEEININTKSPSIPFTGRTESEQGNEKPEEKPLLEGEKGSNKKEQPIKEKQVLTYNGGISAEKESTGKNMIPPGQAKTEVKTTEKTSTIKYLYNKALYLEGSGQFDAALNVYLSILNRGIQEARLYNSIGYLFIKKGRFQEAALYIEKSLEIKKNYLPGLINMGIVKSKTGNEKEAEDYFKRALQIEPDNPELLYNIGLIYEKRSDLKDAEGYYKKLTSIDSSLRWEGFLSLARIKEKSGQFNEAKTIYNRVMAEKDAPLNYKEFARARILTINNYQLNLK